MSAASITVRLDPRSITQLSFIAPQSITDYPLRNQTILAFGGFALLLLARIAADQRKGRA